MNKRTKKIAIISSTIIAAIIILSVIIGLQMTALPSSLTSIAGLSCTSANSGQCKYAGDRYQCNGHSWILATCPTGTEYDFSNPCTCKVSASSAICTHTTPLCPSGKTCDFASHICVSTPPACDGTVISDCMCGSVGLLHSGYCKNGVFSSTAPTPTPVSQCASNTLRCNNGAREFCYSGMWLTQQNGVTFNCPSGYHCDQSATSTSLCSKDATAISCGSNDAIQCSIIGKVCDLSKDICVNKPESCVIGDKYSYDTDKDGCLCGTKLMFNGYCAELSSGLLPSETPKREECKWYQETFLEEKCGIGCETLKITTFGLIDISKEVSGCKTSRWVVALIVGILLTLIILLVYVAKRPRRKR